MSISLLLLLFLLPGALQAQPTITSISPTSAAVGASVTITGTNFDATAANNTVFFGATKATVSAASTTSLTVTVPTGATFGPVGVTVANLTAFSTQFFLPTFTGTGSTIDASNLAAKVDFATGTNPVGMAMGDVDGDGKPDLVAANHNSNTVSVYRNTSSSGTIDASSFAAKVDFTTGIGPKGVAVGDVDGDGKLDLIVTNFNNSTGTTMSVFRNTSSSGTIDASSFAAKVDFTTGTSPRYVAMGDVDGDGKPDLAVTNSGSNTVSVFRNTSTVGTINASSFAAKVDFTTGAGPIGVAMGDVDGDSKPDIAVANYSSNTVSVFRNTSTSGTINASSFAAKVDFTTGTTPNGNMAMGDVDGDGKLDLVVPNYGGGSGTTVSVLRNTSTSGTINASSFAAKVDFTTGTAPQSVAIGDVDGDGKLDLAVTNSNSATVSVYRNTSTSGVINSSSFASKVDFTTGTSPQYVAIGDVDGDGKPDLAVTNSGSNTVSVFRNQTLTTALPTITSFTPTSAAPGASVTITGTNFSTTAGNNTVFFGAVKATVTAASTTSLTVTVPTGATFGPISVTVGNRTAISTQFFLPTFASTVPGVDATTLAAKVDFATGGGPDGVAMGDVDGGGKPDLIVTNYAAGSGTTVSLYHNTSSSGTIDASSFTAKVDFTTGTGPHGVAIGDVDGDSKPDIAVTNGSGTTVSVYRNTATSGTINASSFAAKVDFTTGTSPFGVAIRDLDGDGKPDLVVANEGSNTVSVYRNTSTSGAIDASSFAAKVDFTTGTNPQYVAIGDVDGDGKPDLTVANRLSNTVSVYRNTSTPGTINASSFAAKVDFTTGNGPQSVAIGDVDGDGKLDLVVTNYGGGSGTTVSVLRNTSSSGTIDASSFAAKVDFTTGTGPVGVAIGDVDGDGKLDLAVTNNGVGSGNTVSVYRNTSSSGTINSSSFAAKVDFTTGTGPHFVAMGDVDGDGKPDIAVANYASNTVSVFRNQTLVVPPAPALSSPADGATGQVLSPTLSWSAASGATAYRLQVSTVSNFSSTVFDNASLTGTSQGVGPLSFNTLYYWQVRGSNGNGAGAFSTARSFTTVPNTAPVATAQTAVGNEDADLAVALAGTDVDGQSLSVLISTLPANGSLYQTADGTTRGAQISSVPTTVTDASKRVIYAPLANGNGSGYGNFGFKVNDGLVDSPEVTATVNITAINDVPTLSAIADPAAILENAGLQTVNFAGIGTGAANETQGLTVSATSSNTALIPNPSVSYTSPNASGSLSYTPVSKGSGSATITVRVTDDGGIANGGANTFSQSFGVRVLSVNSVADFTLSYSSPVRAGDRIDLAMTFLNLFGRAVPYTGKVRLVVGDGRILGAGEQQVLNAPSATFPLQTQVFRTADGSTSAIPFRLEVEGVGHQEGNFQVRSRFSIPALSLPVVEVRRGGAWVVFEQASFTGGRTERLRLRNPNRVALRGLADLSYLRGSQPALLGQWEAPLAPGAAQEFELSLPLYLDRPGGAGPLRLFREGREGPPLTLADGEEVRYADAIPEFSEAPFTPVQITPVLLGSETQVQYGVFLSFGLQFQGEEAPRTSYSYAPSQVNGHRFAHSLEVGVAEAGVLEVVQDGRPAGFANRVKVVARTAATAQVQLSLGPLRFVYPLEVAAPAQALLAQITRFEVYQPRPGNLLTGVWTAGDSAVPAARVRAVVEATDLAPFGGIAAVGVEVEGQVIAQQEVEGNPETVSISLEVPLDLPQREEGQVVLAPFALNGLGQRSPSGPQLNGRPFTFAPEEERLQYRPHGAGDRVFGFEGPRPGSQYVAIGVRVNQGQVISTSTARVQVVSSDGRLMDPQGYWVNYPTRMRLVHGDEGGVLLVPRSVWDPQVLARWIRLQTRTSMGIGLGAVGVYVFPSGGVQVDYLFPYVEEGSAAAKPIATSPQVLEEMQEVMAQLAAQMPSPEEVLAAWQRGELSASEEALPAHPALLPNFPNPFNPTTQISFELAQAGRVQLGIYNLLGQQVRVLVDEERLPGKYQLEWDGRDEAGRAVGSGVYFYRLEAGGQVEVRRLMLLR